MEKQNKSWKQKLFHEFSEYLGNFVYMSIAFSSVVLYRRLLLAEHGIHLNDYFAGVIGAAVIAKVVMIGAFLKISRKFEHRALILPVMYKAVLFTIWVMIFNIAEEFARTFIQNLVLKDAFDAVKSHITLAWVGTMQLILIIFIPFFAFKELVRRLGGEKMSELFLKKYGFQRKE
ncbi:MAG TPA: hypothetical protein VLQ91_09815 [Draconibacterium sp.]|nr:hypothetical protein [Draconibacterium sp.]